MKRTSISATLLALALVLPLAACSGNDGDNGSGGDGGNSGGNGNAPAAANAGGNAAAPGAGGNAAAAADPLGKYETPIEVSAVRPISEGTKFNEGESIDDNVWSRAYADQLGIKVKYLWTTPAAQYDQKLNIAIASNDLPDIMPVNAAQLKRMVDDGQVADLSAAYDRYGSELTKRLLAEDGGNALKSGTFDGKLYGLPKMASGLGQADVLWLRTDWLRKLGLTEPKTMDDVRKIAEAFVKQDPDGNGKPDTYGLGVNKDIFGFFAALEGFFNGYHAYPNLWIADGSGKLAYGSVQPQVKAALQKLQEMYKSGLIDKEFGTKDAAKVKDAANAGKLGLFYGYFWNAGWLLDGKKADPAMEWKPIPLPSVDAQPAQAQVPFAISTYYVVKKDAEHPEAAIKLLNFDLEKLWGKTAEPEVYNADKNGNAVFEFALLYGEAPSKNVDAHLDVVKALDANDPAALNAEEKSYYDKIVAYRGGDDNFWDSEKMYGPEGSLAVIEGYSKDGAHLDDAFYGAPTQGMTDNNATLSKLQLEAFTRIIMGGSVDEFDRFAGQWSDLGGKTITDEVNAWQASR
ncbi:extracellular solute-binding protein [Paenibacillus sp. MWE-103]|uniref:Extracellular solute-binding protein n=1 Tax=Paenibacillus artemisiicola TaxID=1172618 RepID=A0ABS3W8T9_9BACL|nr:extracellular solute-binding protein [Paenibacillus artemisiicola]MBO7744581.1 extracellular solute-binding protein [Paenibacillus artemisiicola]